MDNFHQIVPGCMIGVIEEEMYWKTHLYRVLKTL